MTRIATKAMLLRRFAKAAAYVFASSSTLLVVADASAQVHVGNCGPRPINSCSAPSTCKLNPVSGGIWIPGKPYAKGTHCTTNNVPNGPPGTCDGSGTCGPLPAGPSGVLTPKYYILAIVYAPPGNASNVLYSDGSTFGATSSLAGFFGSDLTVGVTGNVIITDKFSVTTTETKTVQINKTKTNSIQAFSSDDMLSHMNDEIYIWVHPQLNYSQAYAGAPVNISMVASSIEELKPLILDINQLTGTKPIPSEKEGQLLDLTPQDLLQIAKRDPFFNPAYQLDTNRFTYVDEVQLAGPDYQGAVTPETPFSISDSETKCKTNAVSTSSTFSVGLTAGVDFFGQGEKAEVIGSVTWGLTGSSGNCNGSTQTAAFTPHSSTVGLNRVVDVYEDAVYHTFMFVEPKSRFPLNTAISKITGSIQSENGTPLANSQIIVTLANGVTRKLYTDAKGNYTLVDVSIGPIKLSAGKASVSAKIDKGQSVLGPLTLHGT